MRVLCVSENYNQSFKSIKLSKKAEICSERIIKSIAKGDFSQKGKDKLYADLYKIFEPYLKKEAVIRASVFYIKEDVLSELKIKFLEMLAKINNETKTADIVKEINNYKPSKYSHKPEYTYKTLDTKTNNGKGNISRLDLVTEDDVARPQSEVVNEYYKKKVETLISKANLSEFQQKRLKGRATGKTFESIAKEDNVSVQVIKQAFRKGVLKIQREEGIIPEEIKKKVKEFSQIIGCDESKFLSAVMTRPDLLFYKPETLKNKVKAASKVFNCSDQVFINAALRQPSLFYQKTETLMNNVKKSAVIFECSEDAFIKAALRFPELFCRNPVSMKNNIKNSAEIINCAESDLMKSALRHPQLFCKKPDTLNKNTKLFSELFNVSFEDSVKIMLKYPALFYRDLNKIRNRVSENAKKLNCTEKYFLEKAVKSPILLCLGTDRLSRNYSMMSYYRKLQNLESNCLSPVLSDEMWHTKMLASLINSVEKDKVINLYRASKSDIINYLDNNPEKTYNFEIPQGYSAESLINFANEISENTLGKKVFNIKIRKEASA